MYPEYKFKPGEIVKYCHDNALYIVVDNDFFYMMQEDNMISHRMVNNYAHDFERILNVTKLERLIYKLPTTK